MDPFGSLTDGSNEAGDKEVLCVYVCLIIMRRVEMVLWPQVKKAEEMMIMLSSVGEKAASKAAMPSCQASEFLDCLICANGKMSS